MLHDSLAERRRVVTQFSVSESTAMADAVFPELNSERSAIIAPAGVPFASLCVASLVGKFIQLTTIFI